MAQDDEFVWAVKSEGHLITNRAGGSARAKSKELRGADPLGTGLARLLRKQNDERAWRIGADGEENVGSRLDRLDQSEWLTLHDIVLNDKGTNLDHLVVGRAGVFSLNTKNHPKKKVVVTERSFRVNGYRSNYLQVAVAEAARVSEVLRRHLDFPVFVHPVIVVMGAEVEVRKMPVDVSVVRRKDLPKWFRRLPKALPEAQVKELQRVAGRPATWRPPVPKEELVLKAWTRGKTKRLYVNDVKGKTLGYRDELTGRVFVDDPKDVGRVRGAFRRRQQNGG